MWCPCCLTTALPFRGVLHIAPLSCCTVLTTFYRRSWLHHVATFIWSEILLAVLTQGRGTLRAFSGPSGDNTFLPGAMHGGQVLQQKRAAEWDVEGDVAFRQHFFKINHPFARQQVQDVVWQCHSYKWNAFYVTSAHYGPSCKVELKEDCSSRKPRTAGTLVLGLPQVMLPSSCGMLCKPVSPGSEPIQCISSESSSLFSDCVCKSKRLLFCPVNHPAMHTITLEWESIYTKFAMCYNVRIRLHTNTVP